MMKHAALALAYAMLCLAEFMIGWAKDRVVSELKKSPPKDTPAP